MINGKKEKIKISEYRYFNFGAGVDDDGTYRHHSGIIWLKKQLTDADAVGNRYWTKVDIRRFVGKGKNARPITRADLGNLDILSDRFDAYDGEPLSQTEK
eukprot:COSAG02_NODE_54238_length_297_cov_0.777778_1_plen_99_part_11